MEDLVTSGLVWPSGLALDLDAGKMYWTDQTTAKIQRANLNGSGVEDLVTRSSGLGNPDGLALDVGAGKMYWTDNATAKIQRANLDGSGVEDLVTSGLSDPGQGLALDAGRRQDVLDGLEGTSKIQRANLDGSGVEDLVSSGLGNPDGLALDVGAGKMYWTDWGTDKIQRANLNGSGVEDLVTSGLGDPLGLALDVGAGKMYWTDYGTDKIQRANLDGSGVEDLVTSGLSGPDGTALDLVAADDHADGPSGATRIAPGDSVEGEIERAGDEDWFRLELGSRADVCDLHHRQCRHAGQPPSTARTGRLFPTTTLGPALQLPHRDDPGPRRLLRPGAALRAATRRAVTSFTWSLRRPTTTPTARRGRRTFRREIRWRARSSGRETRTGSCCK